MLPCKPSDRGACAQLLQSSSDLGECQLLLLLLLACHQLSYVTPVAALLHAADELIRPLFTVGLGWVTIEIWQAVEVLLLLLLNLS